MRSVTLARRRPLSDSGHAPRVVLLGSKPGAIVALEMMLARGFHVHAVVTCEPPQHPWFGGPTLGVIARQRGLCVVDDQSLVPPGEVDVVVSYLFRRRVCKALLARARTAALNFHPAPLPEFGGFAFYNVAILEHAHDYGVTCHHMDEGFDTGPIVAVRRFPFDADRATAQTLEAEAQHVMLELFGDVCDRLRAGEPLPAQPQAAARHRYLTKQEFAQLKKVPASADSAARDLAARAFWFPPYPGAHVQTGDREELLRPTTVPVDDRPVPYAATLRVLRAAVESYGPC